MKRLLAAFLLSALAAYGLVSVATRPAAARRARANDSPDLGFAVGGLIPVSRIRGGEDTLQRLHAAHCATPDRPMEVGPGELDGFVPWAWGSAASVICPGSEIARRETLVGYSVRCDAERADVYARLGRVRSEDMVGCLLVLGARDAVSADAPLSSPDGYRGAFRLRNKVYVWTEKPDGMGGVVDDVAVSPEPADSPTPD